MAPAPIAAGTMAEHHFISAPFVARLAPSVGLVTPREQGRTSSVRRTPATDGTAAPRGRSWMPSSADEGMLGCDVPAADHRRREEEVLAVRLRQPSPKLDLSGAGEGGRCADPSQLTGDHHAPRLSREDVGRVGLEAHDVIPDRGTQEEP